MLRIETRNAKPGMKLALPVQLPQNPARLLLRVGYELTNETINKLAALRVRTLWVGYPSLSFLCDVINPDTIQSQSVVAGQITKTFQTVQETASAKLPYHLYTKSISKLVNQLITHPESAVFLGDLSEAGDDLMRHSSSVTYLSLLMGLKLEGYLVRERRHVDPVRAAEVVNLGVGAMLHDVGVTMLPEAVREKYEAAGDESDPAWREHPALGYRLVRGKVSATAASTVLHHHQHFDGSGYAGAGFPVMRQKRIHVFTRIVTVADQFDRLRYPTDRPAQPTVWALRCMLEAPLFHRYDPQVLDALLAVVPPYAPGSMVTLSDGRHAVVIDHHPQRPCRPIIQLIPDAPDLLRKDLPLGPMLNLAEQSPRLFITQCDGFDVSDLNFERSQLLPRPMEATSALGA
jgi:HD-GYP domain-containing protein (c-di-GMP phosphodiesterase class II)